MTQKEKIVSIAFVINAIFLLTMLTSIIISLNSNTTYVLDLNDIKPSFSNSSNQKADV
jgi:hypothetical protein